MTYKNRWLPGVILVRTVFVLFVFGTLYAKAQTGDFEKRKGKIYKSGKLYSGLYIVQNNDGQKVSEFQIKKGLENGKMTQFYADGKIREVGFYNNGKKDGEWLKWDLNGKKIGQAFYNNGVKSGTWVVWDHNGNKRNVMHYTNGERTGNWQMWDEEGVLIQEKSY